MGRWRNKWENQPAPTDLMPFNQRLFDPVNALISHSDKLDLQSLAQAAASGDPKAAQAYQDKLWNSGLTQDEKLALGEMFMPKQGKQGKIKASPQDVPMTPELKQFIEDEKQYGKGYDVTQEPGYIARMQKAQRDGESSFDYQSGMSPQELEDLKKWYLSQDQGTAGGYIASATWEDKAYVNKGSKKGRVRPTTANETKQAGPVAPPKKSAKERMQEKYGVRPRMSGRGYTEY